MIHVTDIYRKVQLCQLVPGVRAVSLFRILNHTHIQHYVDTGSDG